MFLVTKWWFALPLDGPDKLYWGFPFAFMGEGFHTSMSFQFFILEFLADFILYALIWVVLILMFQKSGLRRNLPQSLTKVIWSLAIFAIISFGWIVSISNPVFLTTRNYDWTIMATGHVFIWQATPRPDIIKVHPNLKNVKP